MIDYRVDLAFPVIPWILQSALNTVQQVSDGESWHQILLKIINEVSGVWPNPVWAKIKKNVLRSQPPRPQDVCDMTDFVAKWGGLPSGLFVKELSKLCAIFVPFDRVVSGNFFRILTDMPLA